MFSSPLKIMYTSIKSTSDSSDVVRLNLFNLASYVKLFDSGIILVYLRCTPPINLVDVVTRLAQHIPDVV